MSLLTIILILIFLGLLFSVGSWVGLLLYRKHEIKKILQQNEEHFPNKNSRYYEIDKLKLHYITVGHGNDIILLHGIGANIYTWKKLIPILALQNRVWAIDLLGFGYSDKPDKGDYDIFGQAKLIREFMKAQGIEKATLVGSSMGALISLQIALDAPEMVSSLILTNPAINARIFIDPRYFGKLNELFVPVLNRITIMGILKLVYAPGTVITPEMVDAYLRPYAEGRKGINAFVQSLAILLDKEILKRAAKISQPTLVLWGEKDLLVPHHYSTDLLQTLPHAMLITHPNAGHHVHEEVPEWTAEKISHFLHTQSPDRRNIVAETN